MFMLFRTTNSQLSIFPIRCCAELIDMEYFLESARNVNLNLDVKKHKSCNRQLSLNVSFLW